MESDALVIQSINKIIDLSRMMKDDEDHHWGGIFYIDANHDAKYRPYFRGAKAITHEQSRIAADIRRVCNEAAPLISGLGREFLELAYAEAESSKAAEWFRYFAWYQILEGGLHTLPSKAWENGAPIRFLIGVSRKCTRIRAEINKADEAEESRKRKEAREREALDALFKSRKKKAAAALRNTSRCLAIAALTRVQSPTP